jgi:hypothetical protein
MNQADHLKRCGLVPPKIRALAQEYLYGKGAPATTAIQPIEPVVEHVVEVETTAPIPEINVEKELTGLRIKIAEIEAELR